MLCLLIRSQGARPPCAPSSYGTEHPGLPHVGLPHCCVCIAIACVCVVSRPPAACPRCFPQQVEQIRSSRTAVSRSSLAAHEFMHICFSLCLSCVSASCSGVVSAPLSEKAQNQGLLPKTSLPGVCNLSFNLCIILCTSSQSLSSLSSCLKELALGAHSILKIQTSVDSGHSVLMHSVQL